jgi:hypothetical protein
MALLKNIQKGFNAFDGMFLFFILGWIRMELIFKSNIEKEVYGLKSKIVAFLICVYYIVMIYYTMAIIMMALIIMALIFKSLILSQFAKINDGKYPIVVEDILNQMYRFATDKNRLIVQIGILVFVIVYAFIIIVAISDDKTNNNEIVIDQIKFVIDTSAAMILLLNGMFIAWMWFQP